MAKYRKARAWVGKELSLNVGRGDMKVLDGVDYEDPRLARFVSLGFLVEVRSAGEAQVAVKPSKPQPAAPAKAAPPPAAPESPAASGEEQSPQPAASDSSEGDGDAPRGRGRGGRRSRADESAE